MEYIKVFNIVVSFDSKYLKLAETMIYSLLKNNGMDMNIYLLYSHLEKNEIEEVNKLIKKLKSNVNLIPIFIDKNKYKKFFTTDQFPIEACYRLIIQDVLPQEEKRALWLDSDIIVRGSLYDFYIQHFNGNYVVACQDTGMLAADDDNNLPRLGLPQDAMYFNSGVLLMNLEKIRKDFKVQDYFEFMEKNKDIIKYPDQDTINKLFFGKIKHNFHYRYNLYINSKSIITGFRSKGKIKKQTEVFHYPGLDNKPTNYKFANFGFDEFWKYGKHVYGYKKYFIIKFKNFCYKLIYVTRKRIQYALRIPDKK